MAVSVESDSDIKSSSESDDDTPLAKIAKRYKRRTNKGGKLAAYGVGFKRLTNDGFHF